MLALLWEASYKGVCLGITWETKVPCYLGRR